MRPGFVAGAAAAPRGGAARARRSACAARPVLASAPERAGVRRAGALQRTQKESGAGCAVLWLRLGELRSKDNAALRAAAAAGLPVLPVATVPRGDLLAAEAARDLRRVLQGLGSRLVVRFAERGGEERVVAELGRAVGAKVVFVGGLAPVGAVGGLRVVRVPDAVLCDGVVRFGATVWAGGDGDVVGVGFGGEWKAWRRLRSIAGAGAAAVRALMWREVAVGCVSEARVRREAGAGVGLVGLGCMSVAVWDVNDADRRGIKWDEKRGQFTLREWEHAEAERRMNAKERGTEFVRRRRMFLERAFFPDDVTPDYYSFTAWRFAQRCVSATVGVFGTQALLLALGVKAGRIGQAAAISWVLKDGLGRVGKMLWASVAGKDFDVDPKRWRFRSALLYAMGNGMEIVTQIFPASFLVVATLANSMKQVSMLTASATRNAMYRSFGDGAQNIANITAKGEAQIVVADLIGMACGIRLSKLIGTSKANVLAAYSILTALDIFGIYMELRQVVFRTLNAERSSLLIEEYVKSGHVLRPPEVSHRERIFIRPRYRSRSRFSSIAKAPSNPEELDMLLNVFRKERFLIAPPRPRKKGSGKPRGPCRVVLRNDASNEDVLRALLTVGYVLDGPKNGKRSWTSLRNGHATPEALLKSAQREANRNLPALAAELKERGWNLDNLLFATVKRGASWGPASRAYQ